MPTKSTNAKLISRYDRLIEDIFFHHHTADSRGFVFEREELVRAAKKLRIELPKNLGDIVYSYRYRKPLPKSVQESAPAGQHWIIRGVGDAAYEFALTAQPLISPDVAIHAIKIPDATPGIIAKYAMDDEQALLAKVRYNRLVDIFTGAACYSLQSHLRSKVSSIGQVEVDELYVGVDRTGTHYVLPVQAKGGRDHLSIVQIEQDIALCAVKFPYLVCRPVAAQFLSAETIALFELALVSGIVGKTAEKHYRLVPPGEVSNEDLRLYQRELSRITT